MHLSHSGSGVCDRLFFNLLLTSQRDPRMRFWCFRYDHVFIFFIIIIITSQLLFITLDQKLQTHNKTLFDCIKTLSVICVRLRLMCSHLQYVFFGFYCKHQIETLTKCEVSVKHQQEFIFRIFLQKTRFDL